MAESSSKTTEDPTIFKGSAEEVLDGEVVEDFEVVDGEEEWEDELQLTAEAHDYIMIIPLKLRLTPEDAEEFGQEIKEDVCEIHMAKGESVGDVEVVTRELAIRMFQEAVKEGVNQRNESGEGDQ